MSELDTNPEALVEQGLQLYSQGRLDEALDKWHAALAIAPEHNRAREYLRYVEDNRSALEESFRLARGSSPGAAGNDATFQATTSSRTQTMEIEEIEEIAEIGAIEIALDDADLNDAGEGAGEVDRGSESPGAESEALTRKMSVVSKASAELEDEYTPRIDLAELRERVAESRRRLFPIESPVMENGHDEQEPNEEAVKRSSAPTPARLTSSISQENRQRRETPLTVIEGGGEKANEEFDPADLTPVRSFFPEPSRLLRSDGPPDPGAEVLPHSAEPGSGQAARLPAPSELGLASVGDAAGTSSRLTPVPAAPKSGNEQKRSATPARGFYSEQRGESDLPGPLTPTGAKPGGQQESMLSGARQLYEQGTYEGSLWLCERVLTGDPNNAEAKELLTQNREILLDQYRREISDFAQVPVVLVPQHEIVWHKLDHRAGFLLSRIDGMLSYEDLLDVSGMSEFEACRILAQLKGQGIVGSQG